MPFFGYGALSPAPVTLNLLLLFFFKYTGFFTEIINDFLGSQFQPYNVFAGLGNLFSGGKFDVSEIILPVGISFYTFQTISYSHPRSGGKRDILQQREKNM